MRRAVRWAIVAGALGVAVPASSRADDKAVRDAQARFEEGLGRVKAGDFEGARLSFAQAYTVLHKPDILWNLALSEQKSGHLVDALDHFRELGRLATSDADRASAGNHVSELMAQTGHIEVLAPAGARVSVDGAAAGVAPLAQPVDVFPGKHHVEARTAQGTKTADAETVAGQLAHVSFMVADAPAAGAGAGAGTLGAAGSSPAPGASAASSGDAPAPMTPPPDTVMPENAGRPSTARIVTVAAIGGLAVVAGGMGLGFGLASNGDADKATTLRQQNPDCSGSSSAGCQQLKDTVNAQHDGAVLSRVFWVTGGVLAVGAVATWFLWPKASASVTAAGVSVVPMIGPGSAGAAAMGSF